MTSLKPENFPIDNSITFKPDVIFYLHRSSVLSNEGSLKDITQSFTSNDTSVKIDCDQAAQLAKSVQPSYFMKRRSWIPTRIDFLVADEATCLATISVPVLSDGTTRVQFPKDSIHSDHNIEVRPIGPARSEEYFVKDSVLYFLSSDRTKSRRLYKAVGQRSIQIGSYEAKSGRSKDGVLSLVTSELDALVGFSTLFAYLTHNASFSG
jgi:hypothetical protein